MTEKRFILNLSCEDQPRIVATVTGMLAGLGGNIAESAQFWDRGSNRFFMRIVFTVPDEATLDSVRLSMSDTVRRFDMELTLADADTLPRIIILVSKFDHCLEHLLYQIRVGWLRADVAAIVSNHEDARDTADRSHIPFHHWPVTRDTKADQEQRLDSLVAETRADLIILARYMQVLSDAFSSKHFGRVINIHHSFLPSFKGAKPYHQAHARGVKIIGATGHYVTPDLDEGPIIEQETERVSHALTAEDFVAVGRDVESRVLGRAVKLHLERRVLLNGNRTVVFS